MPTKRKMVHVYVTPEEKELLENAAAEKKTSLSKWLLYLGLNAAKTKPDEAGKVEAEGPRVVVSKPERTKDGAIPPPPSDGVQRGFMPHPSKKREA